MGVEDGGGPTPLFECGGTGNGEPSGGGFLRAAERGGLKSLFKTLGGDGEWGKGIVARLGGCVFPLTGRQEGRGVPNRKRNCQWGCPREEGGGGRKIGRLGV